MVEEWLERYVEQGRGCGCPGDDLLDDQARYLLGVHRTLDTPDRTIFEENLVKALREAPSAEGELLAAFAVVGRILGLNEAEGLLARSDVDRSLGLRQRAEALGRLWHEASTRVRTGAELAPLLRSALQGQAQSPLLAHAPPSALAEAWDLERSTEARTRILHLLGDRSDAEKRSVEAFLGRVVRELDAALPGGKLRWWRRWTAWLRRSAAYDRLYLELMRSLPALSDLELRRDFLGRCAAHPSAVIARRAVRQLFLEADASGHPERYRAALERLASSGPRFLREEASYAVSLLPPPTSLELLAELGQRQGSKLDGSFRNRARNRRLRSIYHLEPLALEGLERTMEPGLAPDCAQCPDRCCKGPTSRVSLRFEDVLRLRAAGLEGAIETEKRPFSEEEKARFPHLEQFERDRAYAWFPVLQQKPDGTCVFYGADGKCSIYEHRPLLCRAFPYQIDLGRRQLKFSERCPSRRLDAEAAESMARAAVQNFNAKIQDLLLVHQARADLEALDLTGILSLRHDPPE